MVTLYLLRHGQAKSAPEYADIDRPLTEIGLWEAKKAAAQLEKWQAALSLILCSSSQRTRDTLAAIQSEIRPGPRIEIEEILYSFDPETVLTRLKSIPKSETSVLVIGHNPALEQLTGLLAADGTPSAMRQLATVFPTCALAKLAFTTDDWASLGPNTGRLEALSIPNRE